MADNGWQTQRVDCPSCDFRAVIEVTGDWSVLVVLHFPSGVHDLKVQAKGEDAVCINHLHDYRESHDLA